MSAKATRTPRARQAVLQTASEQLPQHADEVITLLKAMARRSRLLLCERVAGGHLVGELAASVDLAQATVSPHLSLRRRDGVVSGRREAQTIHFRISDPRAQALMATLLVQSCVDG